VREKVTLRSKKKKKKKKSPKDGRKQEIKLVKKKFHAVY
jgi:hypothetical protein